MAVLACVGAGDLMSATAYGEQHRTLAFLREQRDLAIEPTLLPDALAGRRTAAVTAGELLLEDWIAAGRRPAPGRAIGPCAVAMAYGLLGRDAERERWLGVVAEIRGVERAEATDATGYGELCEAIVLLDQDRPDRALTRLVNRKSRAIRMVRTTAQAMAVCAAGRGCSSGCRSRRRATLRRSQAGLLWKPDCGRSHAARPCHR